MKKYISLLLVLCLSLVFFASCGKQGDGESVNSTLRFSQANSVEEMQKLDGKQVSIIGYMSTLSPITGNFMYLMNLPYQSCPFCVPNTTQLSNTMAVYAKTGDTFEFTDRAIKVTGILEFGDYIDEYGYEYGYRIKDATYSEVDAGEMTAKMQMWQQLAATNVVADVYAMYDYVNFVCFWPTYTAAFGDSEDYLFPDDALRFIVNEGTQFHYGYVDGYFDTMIRTIEEVSDTEFVSLVQNIRDAENLASRALADLQAGEYTITTEYSGAFADGRSQYIMNNSQTYETEMQAIYMAFAQWLAEWEV